MNNKRSGNAIDPRDPRNLRLAGLGLAAITRREAGTVVANVGARAQAACGQLASLAVDARDVASGGLLTVREVLEPRLAAAGAEAWGRIAPLLAGAGVPVAGKAPAKTARRRAPAKAGGNARVAAGTRSKPAARRNPGKATKATKLAPRTAR